ncbi:MAG: hypothetical protein AB7G44_02815 [Bacteroidia bacterium]
MRDNVFVYAVCGGKEHIESLHVSIRYLKQFSKNKIIVVTDSSRNEVSIVHENIIHVYTPENLTIHQASIYIKTVLHLFLPEGNNYCYLDTDIFAVREGVDNIFSCFVSPITFAQDFCNIDEFSPFAINCNCLETFKKANNVYLQASQLYEQTLWKEYIAVQEEINKQTKKNKDNAFLKLFHWLKYYLSNDFYSLNENYKLDKRTKQWLNSQNELVDEKYSRIKFIAEKTGFSWSEIRNTFLTKEGASVTQLKCRHLREQLKQDFGFEVNQNDWKHWNGGVFLFNEQSKEFIEFWHNATMKIFRNLAWKTRDQGTLVATVFNFGLPNHNLLDKNYNFIVDYNNKELIYLNDLTFQEEEKIINPYFLHIFHHFGDKNWPVWQDLEKLKPLTKTT